MCSKMMKLVREHIEFERGLDPKEAIGIGMNKKNCDDCKHETSRHSILWLNESRYNNDMIIEFGYFNQFLLKSLSKKKFKELVEGAKIQRISYKLFPKIIMRYDEDFKKLVNAQNISEEEKLKWWLAKYLQMKKFEKEKQSKEYYNKLVQAIRDNKVDTPILVLSINDETGKNYKFICGGRNRVVLAYILKKEVNAMGIQLPNDTKENINKMIKRRND